MGGRFEVLARRMAIPSDVSNFFRTLQVLAGVAVHIRPLLFSGTSIPVLFSVHSVIRRTEGVVNFFFIKFVYQQSGYIFYPMS